jgi:hypothetical protein
MAQMKRILMFLGICSLCGCELFRAVFGHGRHPLSFKRTPYTGNVAIHGAYYSKKTHYNKMLSIFWLYQNGVVLAKATYCPYNVDSALAQMLLPLYQQQNKEVPYWWGVYKIEGDSLWIDTWMSGDMDYPTYLYRGNVLNDTTLFVANHSPKPDTFCFRAMPVKPDSTNPFID